MNQEVFVAVRPIRLLRMHDESAEHAGHLLHCHVRVIEVRAFLMDVELIDEPSTWLNRRLADGGLAVVLDGVFKSMPVDGSRLRQVVIEDDADVIALIHLDGAPRCAAVEAPEIDGLIRVNLLLHHLSHKMEDLRIAIHCVGKIANVRRNDRDIKSSATVAGTLALQLLGSGLRCGCRQLVCRKKCGTQAECAL